MEALGHVSTITAEANLLPGFAGFAAPVRRRRAPGLRPAAGALAAPAAGGSARPWPRHRDQYCVVTVTPLNAVSAYRLM